jgi:hypothetical protein
MVVVVVVVLVDGDVKGGGLAVAIGEEIIVFDKSSAMTTMKQVMQWNCFE